VCGSCNLACSFRMLMCRFGASQGKLGGAFDVGMKAAARNKWIGFEKGNKDLVLRKVCI
jgi:hypothetical protein